MHGKMSKNWWFSLIFQKGFRVKFCIFKSMKIFSFFIFAFLKIMIFSLLQNIVYLLTIQSKKENMLFYFVRNKIDAENIKNIYAST